MVNCLKWYKGQTSLYKYSMLDNFVSMSYVTFKKRKDYQIKSGFLHVTPTVYLDTGKRKKTTKTWECA